MRAVLIRDWCGPEALTVETVPSPDLPPGCVRIAVHAAGCNFADGLIIAGKYQEKPVFPFSPGFEVAGDILETAPDVTGWQVGDRVFAALDHGGYADEAIARAVDVHAIPAGMDYATAASFPIAYGTSHFSLMDRARLRPGEILLVHGAAGGVGLTAVECGKAAGATVIATAGGPEKVAVALAHGADYGIDYKSEDIRSRVKELTGGRGADVVYDPVGGEIFDASLRCTAPDGRILTIGFAGGTVPQIPANHLLVKNLTVMGVYWGAYRTLAPQRIAASFAQLKDWYEAGNLKPRVSHTFSLDQAAEAILALKARQVTGKAVILTRGQ
ncbi:NADPH:quinone oxidoreductase family protein [Novispirillum itersonii]|uniref:NADPH2:quinone reductase n=1 Tax=Novispirillum itersonii TaxID=189 RepID=A0A7W9ZCT4_NOVIT|nr:NADPH:quinone oxidoreductase family protein [Novispirillum itersonii]MBB6209107.1 NADPH2:quinone reductase [Novispirillum itersonii]